MIYKLLTIALLSGIALGAKGTAYGQPVILDTCTGIHYTDEQDKAAQECWENAEERAAKLSLTEQALKDCVKNYDTALERIEALRQINVELSTEVDSQKVKVKRNRQIAIVSAGSLLGGLVLLLSIK